MSKQRIAVIIHKDLIPPDPLPKDANPEAELWLTEYDVISTLKKMGHDVKVVGILDELNPIRKVLGQFKPHVIFNLLEEFDGQALFDQHVVSYFELMRGAYTGCNPRGLTLARDKSIAKKILTYHKIRTPKFYVFPKNRKVRIPKQIQYPLIVKCLYEEASLGIAQASVVTSDEKLKERVEFIQEKYAADAIAERFIPGREVYVGVMGNYKLQTFHPWILHFDKVENSDKQFYTSKAKFNLKYRDEKGIRTAKADLKPELVKELQSISRRAFKALELNGYARMDFRITEDNEIYLLEANPNPDIAREDDFAESAKHFGYSYEELLGKLISLGKSWASRHAED
jgi:D-alanine-D-alanine ligase